MVETSERFQVPAHVVARDIDEGLMLVDIQTGSTFKLNQVGATIWRRLDGVSDVASIVTELQDRYGIDTDRLLQDIDALLRDLRAQGLILPVRRA